MYLAAVAGMTTARPRWQEWASFALGLWLAVSPWVMDYAAHDAATANAIFLGLALALGSHFQAALDECPGDWLSLAAGVWLIAAPFVLGFAADAVPTATSVSVGTFVAALAGSSLSLVRQDLH
ncbi:MAG: SPW repeat protein [Burkholderiales bacterium]